MAERTCVNRPVRFPLNAADRLLLELHLSLQERGYCGLNVLLVADLDGPLDPEALRKAADRVGQAFPSLSARISYSPFWPRARHELNHAANPNRLNAFEHRYLAETEAGAAAALQSLLNHRFDVTRGPHVLLLHLQTAPTRHKLALLWSHHLMDLEGAHRLLIELDNAMSSRPPALSPDLDLTPPPPMPYFCFRRHYLNWRAMISRVRHAIISPQRPVKSPPSSDRSAGFVVREFTAAETRRFEHLAKQRVSPGPMRYTRYFLAAAARACVEAPPTGRPTPAGVQLFSHVEPLRHHGPRRGIHGNYLTIPWFKVHDADTRTWAAVDAALSPQVIEYRIDGHVEADWCGMSDLAFYPGPVMRRLMRRRAPRAVASLTSFRFGDAPENLGDARITNLTCAGTMSRDPGIMIARSTFADRMSMSVSYFADYVSRNRAADFLRALEARMLGES